LSGLPTYQNFGVYLALCSIAQLSLELRIAMRSIVLILSLVLLGTRSEVLLFACTSYGPGEYAYNVLSLWADFGIGLFLSYIVMFIGALVVFVRYQSTSSNGIPIGYPIGLWVATGIPLVVAKSFGYPAVPVLLGVASYMLNETINLSVKPSLAAVQAQSGCL